MKNKKRIIILASVFIVLVLVFKLILSYTDKPAVGTVNMPKITTTTLPQINVTPVLLSSQYVSFDYPKGLKIDSKNKPTGPIVDDYLFSYSDIEPWNLAISIYLIPLGGLSDNNAYQLRKINPTQYQQSTQVVNGQNVIIMSDKTISYYNKVAFLVHGSYQATISLSGDDQNGDSTLVNTLKMILSSWTWKLD
ncbi:MAG TPA: hypothetical protein VII94_04985 [Candidatus Saccharimonadales bacterium]